LTKKENNTLNDAVAIATSVAYTKKEIQKLKSLLEEKTKQPIVEYIEGPAGTQGLRGPIGATGAQGERGIKGNTGERGVQGFKGEVGPQGNMGLEGPRGLKGDKGDKGDQGIQGEVGPQGLHGDKGDTGDRGERGPQGDIGPQGVQGKDGRDGVDGQDGKDGAQGLKGQDGAAGPKGESGKDGQQGAIGPQGLQGIQGEKGDKGDKGDPGKDADLKAIEQSINQFKEVLQKDVTQYKAKVNTILSDRGGGSSGGGEVNLRYLDDVDTTSLTDGYVLAFNESIQKFEFVAQSGGGGGTVDNIARTRATNAWNTANSAYTQANSAYTQSNNAYVQANTATTLAQAAYNQANTGGGAGTDTLARTTANTATTLAQSAFNKANTGTSQLVNGSSIVSLSNDDILTVPGPISGLGNSKLDFTTYGSNTAYLTTTSDDSTALFMGLEAAELYAHTTVQLRANTAGISQDWTFNADGTLRFPDNTTQTTAFTGTAIDSLARNTANTATTLAQAAYNQANTGGAASESLNVVFTNNNASSYKMVALNVTGETILASSLQLTQIDRILGVLNNAGQTVTFGSVTNPSWTWTPEQSLYLGDNGNIVTTSTIDGAAFSLKIGYAISSTKAFIKIGTPVVL
jgi:hypothetical protein